MEELENRLREQEVSQGKKKVSRPLRRLRLLANVYDGRTALADCGHATQRAKPVASEAVLLRQRLHYRFVLQVSLLPLSHPRGQRQDAADGRTRGLVATQRLAAERQQLGMHDFRRTERRKLRAGLGLVGCLLPCGQPVHNQLRTFALPA